MKRLPFRVLYYGREERLPKKVPLQAGPLSLIYEAGELRTIKLGQQEILRRVYVVFQDRNWTAYPWRIFDEQIESGPASFRLSYQAEARNAEIDFAWQATITGDTAGTITFTWHGVARAPFLRNRLGFCVLHPSPECDGRPVRVEKVTGEVEEGAFPQDISPHQPFLNIRAIAHEVEPDLWVEVRFTGETFEMEDHRNWSDASYKIYSTPISLPFPVELERGTSISQTVQLKLSRQIEPAPLDEPSVIIALQKTKARQALPYVGLGAASHGQALNRHELARLRALNLSHLRVDLDLSSPDYVGALRRVSAQAKALGVQLEVALFLSDEAAAELDGLEQDLADIKPDVYIWLIFHQREKVTSAQWLELARRYLAQYDPVALIGGGTNLYFTELNRQPPPLPALDLVSFSINPQVHTYDNLSLVQTLAVQGTIAANARRLCGQLPLAISPITLRPRFNPNATGPEGELGPGDLPRPVDVRQMSLFGAGWTALSLKYIAESGAISSVTYYETTGWRGVMERETGSPIPDKFRSLPGGVFPLYHILADVGEFAVGEVIPTVSSHPLEVNCLALHQEGRTRLLVANLSGETKLVRLKGFRETFRVRYLDESNVETAMHCPEAYRTQAGQYFFSSKNELTLWPYAIARLDQVYS